MKTPKLIVALLGLLLAPVASADHGDALHGVAPHSVGDSPLDIVAVSVSTPHPYPLGETFTYAITVDRATTLSIHFERYDLNGWSDWFTGACMGSEVRVLDANTGFELDAFCGYGEADFWTGDYETNALLLEFETGGWESGYGFDVFEVAVDGARPVASVPYSDDLQASADPSNSVTVDPFNPGRPAASAGFLALLEWGTLGGSSNTNLDYGSFWDCQLSCTEVNGFKLSSWTTFGTGDSYVDLQVALVGTEQDGAPGGIALGEPTVEASCNVAGTSC